MSSISKELKLSQKYAYAYRGIRTMAVSLLDQCNFEARHIMRVSGHKSEGSIALTPGVFRRLSRKKSLMLSVVPVLLKILSQLALQLW